MGERESWPAGLCREIAVLELSEEEAVRHFGVIFRDDCDDLDHFRFAFVQAGDRPYALERYRGEPNPGLTLFAIDDDRAPSDQLDRFLSWHALDRSIVRWIAPDNLRP
jgi:hypothetical protein